MLYYCCCSTIDSIHIALMFHADFDTIHAESDGHHLVKLQHHYGRLHQGALMSAPHQPHDNMHYKRACIHFLMGCDPATGSQLSQSTTATEKGL